MQLNYVSAPARVNPQVQEAAVCIQDLIDLLRYRISQGFPVDADLVAEIRRLVRQVDTLDHLTLEAAWVLEVAGWN